VLEFAKYARRCEIERTGKTTSLGDEPSVGLCNCGRGATQIDREANVPRLTTSRVPDKLAVLTVFKAANRS